jgi:phospholipid/cholesterol/gamma-HCH transport system permease protein
MYPADTFDIQRRINENTRPDMENQTADCKIERSDQGEISIIVSGRVDVSSVPSIRSRVFDELTGADRGGILLDLSGATYIDSAGVALAIEVKKNASARHATFSVTLPSGRFEGLKKLIDEDGAMDSRVKRDAEKKSFVEKAGEAGLAWLDRLTMMLTFAGDTTLGMLGSIRNPKGVRWGSVAKYAERAGADALPIVALINFLMGMVMGFQAALQLRQFGANIFSANLVGVSITRELGPLMTAIIVAGRSGSAFAAEIGTMKVSEEVSALTAMGIDPVKFLVVPKIIALMLMLPILTLFADLLGVLGGLSVGMTVMNIPYSAYINQTYRALYLGDIFSGVLKSVFFAVIIAVIGCYRGFQASGDAESVGTSATSSVVTSIFLVILFDALFTVILSYL